MLIAFEGPDNTGKSHSAAALSGGNVIYNATKENHAAAQVVETGEKGLVQCFDRIDWLTHMAYRLALPEHEWNDPRVRTVFAMPDTHLVFKLHDPNNVPAEDTEEGYSQGVPASVNALYSDLAWMILQLNEVRHYALFKTVTIVEVSNNPDPDHQGFYQRIKDFSSPLHLWGTLGTKLVVDDQSLLEFLQREDDAR